MINHKLIQISFLFVLIGLFIVLIGFGIGGFNLANFKLMETNQWYQTIHF